MSMTLPRIAAQHKKYEEENGEKTEPDGKHPTAYPCKSVSETFLLNTDSTQGPSAVRASYRLV